MPSRRTTKRRLHRARSSTRLKVESSPSLPSDSSGEDIPFVPIPEASATDLDSDSDGNDCDKLPEATVFISTRPERAGHQQTTIKKELWDLVEAWLDKNPHEMPPCALRADYNPASLEVPKSVIRVHDQQHLDYYVIQFRIQRKQNPVTFCVRMLEDGNDQFFVMKRGGRRYNKLYKWLGGYTIETQPIAEINFKEAQVPPETRTVHSKRRKINSTEREPEYPIRSSALMECRFIDGDKYRPWVLNVTSTVVDVFGEAGKFYGKEPHSLLYQVEGEVENLMPCMLKDAGDFEFFRSRMAQHSSGIVNLWRYN